MFDWPEFLNQNRVEFVTSGPNVSRGYIAIHCPLCGSQDPSQHMTINLDGKGWRCWRNVTHRNRDEARLVQLLLKCSYEQAVRLVKGGAGLPDDFHGKVMNLLGPKELAKPRTIKLPDEFLEFKDLPSCSLFFQHLFQERMYQKDVVLNLFSRRYGMRYCTRGPYKGRIIFPVELDRKLMTWTGRTVYRSENLRYKTLSPYPEKAKLEGLEPAMGGISSYLLWFDMLKNFAGDTIFLTEGPFDALRVNILGYKSGICATCFFTNNPSDAQIMLLHELLPRFKYRYLLLDQETLPNALRALYQLTTAGTIRVKQLPYRFKDPGELKNFSDLQQLCA